MSKRTIVAWMISLVASVMSLSVAVAGFPELPLNLGSADNFSVVAKSGITNAGGPTTSIMGDISNSPGTAAQMNTLLCSNMNGYKIWGVDDAFTGTDPCEQGLAGKSTADLATFDMETAYVNAAGRITPDTTELGAGDISGLTIPAGLHKWSTNVLINADVYLDAKGDSGAVWIFQIAGDLTTAAKGSVPTGVKVILSGGAKADNIFWQVGGVTGATIETYSTFNGTILSLKQVIVKTGAVLNGRALAQTQVTLDANPVTYPPALAVNAPVLEGHLTGSTTVSGQPFLLTLTVTNTGNADAVMVAARAWNSVGQRLAGPTASSTSYQMLYVGQKVTFSWTATQAGSGNYIFSSTAMEESASLAISPVSTSTIYLTYAPVLKARLDGVTPTTIGQVITFNLTVTNTGGATATNVTARAWTAAGVALVNLTRPSSATSYLALYPGQTVRFTWTLTATTTSMLGSNVFSATASEQSWMLAVSPLATATVLVQTASIIAAQLVTGSATVVGGAFRITLTVTNNGQASTVVSMTTTAFLIGGVAYTATAYAGPNPAMPLTLTAGGSARFTWTVTGVNIGAGVLVTNTVYYTDVNVGPTPLPLVVSNNYTPPAPPAPGAAGSFIYPSPPVMVFPNPVPDDRVTIALELAEDAVRVEVEIFNAAMQRVRRAVWSDVTIADGGVVMDGMQNIMPGVYLLRVRAIQADGDEQRFAPVRLVIQRSASK